MIKRLWVMILLLGAAAMTASAQKYSAQGVEDRLIVAFQPGMSDADQIKSAEAKGLTVLDSIPSLRVLLVKSNPGKAGMAQVRLMSDPDILMVGPDIWRNWLDQGPVSFQDSTLPGLKDIMGQLPRASALKTLRNPLKASSSVIPWGVAKVNAPAAWAKSKGRGVKVAVIDTGIAPNHPDLKVAGGHNALDKNAPWHDDHFHGTHVAGTIAATLNDTHVVGVAPEVSLYAVKVLSKDGSGGLFSIMGGVMWVAQNGIHVANMSLGAPQEIPFLQFALKQARSAGVTIVAAAGNDGKAVNWPGAYPETIAVSALCPAGVTNTKLCLTPESGIAAFSSRGPEIDLIAPGVMIPSTVPLSKEASGVASYSGTSMACPHVAGLAALAVAAGAKSPDAVLAMLKSAAVKLPGLSSSEQGAGLVDAARIR